MSLGTVSQSLNGYDYTVTSTGVGIGSTDDNWGCANLVINGNGGVIFKIGTVIPGDSATPVAGICIRDGTTLAGASQARAVYLEAGKTQLTSRYRTTAGGAVVTAATLTTQGWSTNPYLRVVRSSQTAFAFYYSTDSNNWIALGTASVPGMPQSVYVQLYGGIGNSGSTGISIVFQQVNIQQLSPINYTFTGLTAGTAYTITAVSEDLALNSAAVSAPVTMSTHA